MSQIIDPSVVYQRLLVFAISLGVMGAPLVWAGRYWPTASLWAALIAGVGLYPLVSRKFFQWTDHLPLFRTRVRPLHELARHPADLLGSANVQEWAWKTMASVKRGLGVRCASLLVWDEGLRAFLVKAGFGLAPDQLALLSLEPDAALVRALKERQDQLVVPTLTGDPLSEAETELQADMDFLHAAMAAALCSDGKLFAVLSIGEKNNPTMFNDLEIQAVQTIVAEAERGFQAVRAGEGRREESSLWAHDLARPFGAKGSLGGIEAVAQGKFGPVSAEAVAVLKRAAEEMEFVGRNLGQVIRPGGEPNFDVRAVPLTGVYGRVRERFAGVAEERGIALRVDSPEETLRVLCDEEMMEYRVLGNLVENALRHTSPGGSVELGGRVEGDLFVGHVKDTGVGIRKEDQARVFERGFQAGEGPKGLAGLGLFSVKSVVESQNGKVWVESEAGKGATFFFSLPAASPKTPEQA
jgi:signal transduction histidine kinase